MEIANWTFAIKEYKHSLTYVSEVKKTTENVEERVVRVCVWGGGGEVRWNQRITSLTQQYNITP